MSPNDFLTTVKETARDPLGKMKAYIAGGRRVAGYLCSYVPEEYLYAAGILPLRLLGRATAISKADKHLQTYCCSHVRGFLEDYLNGDYKDLSAVFFANTCDTMQGFYDIFKLNFPQMHSQNLNMPVKLAGDTPFKFAMAELLRYKEGIEKFTGAKIEQQKLAEAVAVYNKNRELMLKLYDIHAANPDAFPSVTLLHASLASMFMDKAELNPLLEGFLAGLGAAGGGKARKPLVLVGSINVNEEVYNLADEFGAYIADDDLCTGKRYFQGLVSAPTDEAILRRYFDRPHCAAKHQTNTSRGEYIVQMAKKSKAAGVIFYYLKFCDPHSFDYPYIRNMLDKAGVRSHLIEVEQSSAPSGQLRTKVQAFIETL